MAGGGRDVVGVEAAHGLLGLEAGEDQVIAAEARAEEGVHGLGGGSGGGRGGAQARPERQALGEVDGDRMGADAEGAERSHGGHASCRLWVERKEGRGARRSPACSREEEGRGCTGSSVGEASLWVTNLFTVANLN